MSNVWAVFHRAERSWSDVAVAAQRSDDPVEWERAHYRALSNVHGYAQAAQRWGRIADEMAAGLARVRAEEHEAAVRRLEGEPPTEGPVVPPLEEETPAA